jgi:hypothetical protein
METIELEFIFNVISRSYVQVYDLNNKLKFTMCISASWIVSGILSSHDCEKKCIVKLNLVPSTYCNDGELYLSYGTFCPTWGFTNGEDDVRLMNHQMRELGLPPCRPKLFDTYRIDIVSINSEES